MIRRGSGGLMAGEGAIMTTEFILAGTSLRSDEMRFRFWPTQKMASHTPTDRERSERELLKTAPLSHISLYNIASIT